MTGPGSELAANAGQPRRKGWIRGRVSALEAAYEGYWFILESLSSPASAEWKFAMRSPKGVARKALAIWPLIVVLVVSVFGTLAFPYFSTRRDLGIQKKALIKQLIYPTFGNPAIVKKGSNNYQGAWTGGHDVIGGRGVWKYDGTWTNIGGPSATGGVSSYEILHLSYDSVHNLLYAGTGGEGVPWEYNGTTWTSTNPSGGGVLSYWIESLAYDSVHNRFRI